MKTTWMLTAMVVAVACAHAGQPAATMKQTMTAYVIDHRQGSNVSIHPAETCASQILAAANLEIRWHHGRPASTVDPSSLTFVIDLLNGTPAGLKPGVLAFALPYEGIHITVFYDRVERTDRQFPELVLGHVLAHEITHLLQGTGHHAETGVMKATYSRSDIMAMHSTPLALTTDGLVMIATGVARRLGTRPVLAGLNVQLPARSESEMQP